MLMMLHTVNWLMVGVAAAVNFIFGMIWYSPMLFGKKWAKLSGATTAKPSNKVLAQTFAVSVITALILQLILKHAITNNCQESICFTLLLGLLTSTAFFSGVIWEKKPMMLFLICSGYILISYQIIAAIYRNFSF